MISTAHGQLKNMIWTRSPIFIRVQVIFYVKKKINKRKTTNLGENTN